MWMMVCKMQRNKRIKQSKVKSEFVKRGEGVSKETYLYPPRCFFFRFPVIQHEFTLTSRIKQNRTEQNRPNRQMISEQTVIWDNEERRGE